MTFFASFVTWFTIPEYFQLHMKGSVSICEGPHLFGQFRLVSSVRVSEGCQVISVLFFEVSGTSRYSRLVNHVLSMAITVTKPECPLEGNCLQPTNSKERCTNHLTSLKL